MVLDKTRVPIHVAAVRRQATIEQVSAAYLRKYKKSRSAQAMVLPETLPTTLRVTPR